MKDLVKQILSEGGKVVIWATFIHTIHGLKHYLESEGICCQELYGATPVEREGIDDDEYVLTREKIVKAFQYPDCPFKVIIANPFAVAESISLHKACHNAIYIERSFNAAHFVQSKDRIVDDCKDCVICTCYICWLDWLKQEVDNECAD